MTSQTSHRRHQGNAHINREVDVSICRVLPVVSLSVGKYSLERASPHELPLFNV
jgi:hypothetical protein